MSFIIIGEAKKYKNDFKIANMSLELKGMYITQPYLKISLSFRAAIMLLE